jgi:hypothetical protein
VNRKKCILALLLSAAFIVKSFAQTPSPAEPSSLADLDREAEKIAVSDREFIRSGSTRTGSIRNEGTGASVLDRYWIETICANLSAAGADNRGITIFQNPQVNSGYVLRCTIVELGLTLRIYTKLIRSSDFAVAATWMTDIVKTPYISGLGARLSGSQDQWDGFEPDSGEQPVFLETGGAEITRSLHEGDEDWFVIIPGEEDGYIVVKTSGSTDTVMELYTDSFEQITENDDFGGDYNAGIGFMARRGNRYLVLVRGYSEDETGSYGIKAVFSDIPDKDLEPNNSMNEASAISADTQVKAFILTDDDEDWYVLAVSGGYFTTRTDGDIDTYLELFDINGEKLAEDDDSGYDTNANISLLISPGTYYLKASAYETGEYTLSCLLREPNQVDAYEPDDKREDAKTISAGEEQRRTFTTGDDAAWVRFTVDSRGYYSIRASGIEDGELDTFLSLYDADAALIDENDDTDASYASLISRELSPGLYYIRVHVLEHPSGSYRLSVTRE